MPSISIATATDTDKLLAYLAKNTNSTVAHDLRWQQIIKNTFGHQAYYLCSAEHDKITGVLPLFLVKSKIFGSGLISMPYLNAGGILADDENVYKALIAAALKQQNLLQGDYLELRLVKSNPLLQNDFTEIIRKVTFQLKLEKNSENLLDNFSAKLRSQIKRPIKAGAVGRIIAGSLCSPRDVENFYSVFSRQMRDLGTPVYPFKFFTETLATFKDDAGLALVELNGQITSAGIFIRHKNTAELIWAASLRAYNKYSVNMCLYWEIIKYLSEEGIQFFDFGRTSPDSGGYHFKKQWGANEIPLPWYYSKQSSRIPNIDPRDNRFSLPVFIWKKLPLSLANYFGPKITRQIP